MTPLRFALAHHVGASSALDVVVMIGMITKCSIQVASSKSSRRRWICVVSTWPLTCGVTTD